MFVCIELCFCVILFSAVISKVAVPIVARDIDLNLWREISFLFKILLNLYLKKALIDAKRLYTLHIIYHQEDLTIEFDWFYKNFNSVIDVLYR